MVIDDSALCTGTITNREVLVDVSDLGASNYNTRIELPVYISLQTLNTPIKLKLDDAIISPLVSSHSTSSGYNAIRTGKNVDGSITLNGSYSFIRKSIHIHGVTASGNNSDLYNYIADNGKLPPNLFTMDYEITNCVQAVNSIPDGANGSNGLDGQDGAQGIAGQDGLQGIQGPAGSGATIPLHY